VSGSRFLLKHPDPFLEVRVALLGDEFGTLALCAGYEGKRWRAEAFADHLLLWLPFAALSQESQNEFGLHNWMELIKTASAHVYKTKKTAHRGEIGELVLHIVCLTQFSTIPVICKLILKTSSNDTVKGFDGVHVRLLEDDDFELWLGESKLYQDPKRAIKEAVSSIRDHIAPDFLNTEKSMLIGHVAQGVPQREKILKLFRSSTSSDDLIKKSVFPVLICYDSESSQSFEEVCDILVEQLYSEIEGLRDFFCERIDDLQLRFQLIFIPMAKKEDLISEFDKRLEAFI
jgi:hypothetical protein